MIDSVSSSRTRYTAVGVRGLVHGQGWFHASRSWFLLWRWFNLPHHGCFSRAALLPTRQNYVDFPKANGYRSVHTTVLHPTGIMMELQVRNARLEKPSNRMLAR